MNIEPIRLLQGMHDDTATTGHGCFMNVIAYLNGESQITDNSPCVCVTVRHLSIQLNDLGTDEQRLRLLPFVLRAMGSATKDAEVLAARVARLRKYGEECAKLMRGSGSNSTAYANAKAYASAYAYAGSNSIAYANANAYANAYAYAYAYASATATRLKASLFDAGLRFLDDVLPAAEPASLVVAERFETLVKMQAEAA